MLRKYLNRGIDTLIYITDIIEKNAHCFRIIRIYNQITRLLSVVVRITDFIMLNVIVLMHIEKGIIETYEKWLLTKNKVFQKSH